jgi:hypothetical protein
MPDIYNIISDEGIARLRERWTPERVADVVRVLHRYPQSAVWRIRKLPWYVVTNGFEQWPGRDQVASDYMSSLYKHTRRRGQEAIRWKLVDLRGIHLEQVKLKNCRLPFADLTWAEFKHVEADGCDFSKAAFESAMIDDSSITNCNFFGAHLRRSLWRDDHIHKCDFSMLDFSQSAIAWSRICHTKFSDTSLQHCQLIGTHLYKCALGGTVLYGADLQWSEFINCALTHIRLRTPGECAKLFTSTYFGREEDYPNDCCHRRNARRNNRQLFVHAVKRSAMDIEALINTCSQVRLCFRDNGLFHEASHYYCQEEYWRTRMEWADINRWAGCRKKGNRARALRALARRLLAEEFMGYGERPGRIIGWSVVLVLLCTIIIFLSGFQYLDGAARAYENIRASELPLFSSEAFAYLGKCLRFSIECFTTLGFSKMQPTEGLSHWVASLEGVIGVLFVALATVTWARKAIRD